MHVTTNKETRNTERYPGLAEPTAFSERSEQCTQLISKINQVLWTALGFLTAYNLLDAGLSRFLVLETLTHGTGPLGYLGISLNGADPNFGGGSTGSSNVIGNEIHIDNSKNYFYVFRDSDFPSVCTTSADPFTCFWMGNKITPRMHAILSGIANVGCSIKDSRFMRGNLGKIALGILAGMLTPTLKFRFTPDEILNCTDSCLFEDDPNYYNHQALRTSKWISPIHLGITGSITQGVNTDMFNRMIANPEKALTGLALLGAAAYVAKRTHRYYRESALVRQQDDLQQTDNCKILINRIIQINSFISWSTAALIILSLNAI